MKQYRKGSFFFEKHKRVTDQNVISEVMKDLSVFFQQPQTFVNTRPEGINYKAKCTFEVKNNTEGIDLNKIEQLIMTGNSEVVKIMVKNLQAVPKLLTNNFICFSIKQGIKSNYQNYQILSFAGNNLDFFKLINIDNNSNPRTIFNKDPLLLARSYLHELISRPSLYIDTNHIVGTFEHSTYIEFLASSTSLAANQNHIIVGYQTGQLCCIPMESIDKPGSIVFQTLINDPYSLCFKDNVLFVFGQKYTYKVDTQTTAQSTIQRPKEMTVPIISDGHLFYSIKKNSIIIFDYVNKSFVTIKELTLKTNIQDLSKVLVATDGASIVFIESQTNEIIKYKAFSTLDGSHLWTKSYQLSGIIGAWNIIPSTSQHVIFTAKNIQIIQGSMVTPRWQIGHSRPNYGTQMSIVDMYDTALFYGIDIFPDATEEKAMEVLNYYSKEGNIPGIRISSYILSRTSFNISSLLATFDLINSSELRRYLFAMTLSAIKSQNNNVKKIDSPIVTKFIMNDLTKDDSSSVIGLMIVLSYAELFDFERIELTPNAANILISKVLSKSYISPHSAEFIIEAYLANFAAPKLVSGEAIFVFVQFQTISQLVQEEISRYAQANALDRFEKTVVFRVWKRLLYCIHQAREFWPSFASTYVKCLDISLDYELQNLPDSIETVKMLNRSYYLLLALMFSTNYEKQYIPLPFKEFIQVSNSIYDGSDPEVDELSYEIVSRMYNIQNDWAFQEQFIILQERFLYCSKEELQRAKLLLEKVSFCSSDVPIFLDNIRDTQMVEQISSVIHWFVRRFGRDKQMRKQTLNQFIIMSFFSKEMEDRFIDFMMTDNDNLRMFVEYVRFPFILHPDVVRISLVEITSKMIFDSPTELIEDYFDNIVKCINFQQNKSKLANDLLKDVRECKAINSPSEILRHSLYLNLIASSIVQIDYSHYLKPFRTYYMMGNYESLENFRIFLSKISDRIDISPFFDIICSSIESGKFERQNVYESIASLFLSIDILRTMVVEHSQIKTLLLSKSSYVIAEVLNDTLECVRNGISIEFEDSDGILQEGTVIETIFNDSIFEISSGAFSFDAINRLIIHRAPFDIQLNKEELQTIVTKYSQSQINVFICASIAFLSQKPLFVSMLSESMKENILTNLIPEYFPGNCYSDYLYFLGESKKKHFSFSFDEIPNNNTRSEGIIVTENIDKTFTSPTISPFKSSKLTLNAEMNEDTRTILVVNAFSNITGERFETDSFLITNNSKTETTIDSSKHIININDSDQYFLSPSITTVFFTLKVENDTIIFYNFSQDLEIEETYPYCFPNENVKYMKPGRLNQQLPSYDSDQFISNSFERNSFLVSESLRKIAAMNISLHNKVSMPKLALELYATSNPYVYETSVEKEARIFGGYSEKFIEFAKEQSLLFGYNTLQNALEKMIDSSDIFISKTNSTALFIGTDKISLSDSFVVSPLSTVPIKVIGVDSTFCHFSTQSIVIPSRELNGTILALPVHLRHLLYLGRNVHVRSCKSILLIIEKVREILPSIADSLFKNIIELVKYLFVEPLRESAMPDFDLGALLFSRSTIFDYPQSIKAKALEISSVSMELQNEPINLSFIQDTPIFLGIRSPSTENTVTIEYDDGKELMESDTYIILKTHSLKIIRNNDNKSKIMTYITPVLPSFDSVVEEIRNWKDEYSQFLLNLDVSSNDFIHAEFNELPISSLVSYQTAKTVYAALESVRGIEIFENRFGRTNKDSCWCDFDSIGDYTKSLPGRVQFLRDMGFSRQTIINSVGMAFSNMPMISHSDFADNFDQIFVLPHNIPETSVGFLRQFTQDLNPYTVLSFIHAVSSKWEIDSIINGFIPIKVLSIETKIISSEIKDQLLIVGKFDNYADFIQKMMEFICSKFV